MSGACVSHVLFQGPGVGAAHRHRVQRPAAVGRVPGPSEVVVVVGSGVSWGPGMGCTVAELVGCGAGDGRVHFSGAGGRRVVSMTHALLSVLVDGSGGGWGLPEDKNYGKSVDFTFDIIVLK